MTINEAITRTDSVKPNEYSLNDKIKWLEMLDDRIMREIIDTHEMPEEIYFYGYTNTPIDIRKEELLMPFPAFEGVYTSWLMAQIDFANMDTARYNNSMIMFNQLYSELCAYVNANFMPKGKELKY